MASCREFERTHFYQPGSLFEKFKTNLKTKKSFIRIKIKSFCVLFTNIKTFSFEIAGFFSVLQTG